MKMVMALMGLFAFVGCGGNESLVDCAPGRQEACPCEGGGQGIQVCSAHGAFGACECGGGSEAGGEGGGSQSSSAGTGGGATGSGGGSGGAPAGCDLHPAADGFMCVEECPAGDYHPYDSAACNRACYGGDGNTMQINPQFTQDLAFVFPAVDVGSPSCNVCAATTAAKWTYTLGLYGDSGCARFTTNGPGQFSMATGPMNATICGTAPASSCLSIPGSAAHDGQWITYRSDFTTDPFWIRVETVPGNACDLTCQ